MTQMTHEGKVEGMPVVKIMENGQVTIPKKIRDELGLKKGDLLEAERKDSQIVITPKRLIDKEEAWEEMRELLEKVHARNKGFTEEEVATDVLEAITEHRREKRANPHES